MFYIPKLDLISENYFPERIILYFRRNLFTF